MSSVQYTVDNGIAELRLNRPEKHNAFDGDIITQLIKRIKMVNTSRDVRVLLLSAAGKNFSAGADLNWMRSMVNASVEENQADAENLADLMEALYHCSKPTIARVQGSAYGGALGLVCCCDLAVGSTDSRFCLSEVKLGLVPAVISPYVNRCIGNRQMSRYTLTAEVLDASTAVNLGILSIAVAPERLDAEVAGFCQRLKQNGPEAMSAAKTLLHHVQNAPLNRAMHHFTSSMIAKLRVGGEGQEGVNAFFDKRPPNWQ